ncbi:energy-coupling factor transporter transmembrane component T family protein [Treponema maltophilum]|uniref:energy-coupling factor transporter transmembrane component T family protein n=1 Tax=Treponema maltophilum TaxID=51160 RepID=UPI003D925889
MKAKLFDYIERDNFIYRLSGLTKLVGFFCMTFAVMFSYDIRFISCVFVFSLVLIRMADITFSQIRIMLLYVIIFLVINFVLTFLFSPLYGTEIYGTRHDLFSFGGRYVLTEEQLLYQITKTLKYASVVPLGIIFFLSTNPSEFAASVNRIGLPYKAAFAFSLTLRYFPDLIRDYENIAAAQQTRGLDLSKKEKVSRRMKNVMNIFIPLVFSTLDRIDTISNTMDLRGFGKGKRRSWYAARPLKKGDVVSIVLCAGVFVLSLCISVFINHSRFFNPFV